jgi:hypothetical protein
MNLSIVIFVQAYRPGESGKAVRRAASGGDTLFGTVIFDQAILDSEHRQFQPRGDADLRKDICEVVFNGPLAD